MNTSVIRRRERIDRGIKARAEDVFVLTSWREMLYLAAPRVMPALGFLLLPLILDPYWQKVLLAVAVYGLLAISWDILAQSGIISLGQSLFFGMGAYLTGAMNHYWHLPVAITLPVASLLGGLICTLMLLPVLRLRGIYFSMVTLIIPLMLVRVIEATRLFGGTDGLSGIVPLPSVRLESYLATGMLLVAMFGFQRLLGSDYGLVIRAIRDNDRTVISAGLNIYWFKAQVLLMAGTTGAFAGAFMTHVSMFAGMSGFALDYSILPIAAAVVGGQGSLAGAVLGALILVPLSEILRGAGSLRVVFYSLLMVLFIITWPGGLFQFIQRKYHQSERWVAVER
ncbi:branched-chain amino acid ABC transporter permease [Desulfosarcina ovata]|uniref:Branched-chain amino acid ABC transporter permease n=1 Tax=Desulfosarcina ovata subsp. ovata TaxID=2752305 RepID=A0A5K8AKB2_9BACT|nr:branched-chain amino acid ABC transporter permease [Desulfosarcina ovata]BBO93155.1 branched-chain amino acid ABC transporter permease [Desulfosarcina ovata subsp. ovata]